MNVGFACRGRRGVGVVRRAAFEATKGCSQPAFARRNTHRTKIKPAGAPGTPAGQFVTGNQALLVRIQPLLPAGPRWNGRPRAGDELGAGFEAAGGEHGVAVTLRDAGPSCSA